MLGTRFIKCQPPILNSESTKSFSRICVEETKRNADTTVYFKKYQAFCSPLGSLVKIKDNKKIFVKSNTKKQMKLKTIENIQRKFRGQLNYRVSIE